MQITLITDGSIKGYEIMNRLDELGIEYELQKNKSCSLPTLNVDDKEMSYAKALRWIKKWGDRNGDII